MPKYTGGIERKYLWLDALHHHTQGRVRSSTALSRPRKHRFYIERDELDNLARAASRFNTTALPPARPGSIRI